MSLALLLPVLIPLAKVALAIALIRVSWQLWWNRPGAVGREIPGDMGWPIIGHSLKLVAMEPRMFVRAGHEKYGPVFKSHILGRPTVFIQHPDDIKKCLLGEERIVESLMPESLIALLAEGSLLGQHGEEYKEQRAILLRCLTPPALQHLINVLQPIVQNCASEWIRVSKAGKPADIYSDIKMMTFALSQTIVYGEYTKEITETIGPILHVMNLGALALPVNLPFTIFGRALRAKKMLRVELAKDILKKEEEYLKLDASDVGPGYAYMLLADRRAKGESGKTSIDGLLSQMTLVLAAANETTAAAMAMVADGLTTRPDLVQQLYEEQQAVFGTCKVLPTLDISVFRTMPKLDCAIREILRMRPVAAVMPRKAITPWEMHNGMTIPYDWGIYMSFDACMTKGGTFAAQDQFIPERFSKECAKEIQPTQWDTVFFGGGARRCPGAELGLLIIKTFVSVMICSGTIRYEEGNKVAFSDTPGPTPRKNTPLHVFVEPRQH